jgi:hypothetical protein
MTEVQPCAPEAACRIAVIVPYFNPAGYRSHREKIERCLESFDRAGIGADVFVAVAGPERPPRGNVLFWDDDHSFLWHKERLVNLAARRLPPGYTHVVWSDNDILVGADWPTAIAAAFQDKSVVQCFGRARYRTADGHPCRSRAGVFGSAPEPAIGLSWGARLSLFTDGPGLFDLALVGGGDSVLGYGVLQSGSGTPGDWNRALKARLIHSWSPGLLAALETWQSRLDTWLAGTLVGAADVEIEVLEHGTVDDRQYADRHRLLRTLVPERHLLVEDDRVFRWSPVGRTTIEPAVRGYFYSRREDAPLTTEDGVSAGHVARDPYIAA